MKRKPIRWLISFFIISIPIFFTFAHAQADSARRYSRYLPTGIRIGYDAGKKIWSIYHQGNIDEFNMHINFHKHIAGFRWGRESMPYHAFRYTFFTTGQYWKIGYSYNFYDNWPGMRNEITVGLRYGAARFDYRLTSLTRIPLSPLFSTDTVPLNRTYRGLKARWLETVALVRAEIWKGLFLEIHAEGKVFLNGTPPENFGLIYIPGFYTTNISGFGFGLGYGISYFFDLKRKKESRLNILPYSPEENKSK